MKKSLKSISLCMTLLLIFQLLIPFSALAEGTLTPSLSKNSEGNYTVSSVEDLNTMRSDIDKGINYAGKTIVLTQDIDLSQAAVALNFFATQNTFSGCFDGKSHTISGYTDAKSGLFSMIDSNGYVRNLRIAANVVINDESAVINSVYYNPNSTHKNYGLIANECWGLINRCSTTGTVTSNVTCNVGGIVGYNMLTMTVDGETTILNGKTTNSFSNIIFNNQATGSVNFAGITIRTGDIIEHCYFYGQYTGNTLTNTHKQPIRVNGISVPTCAYDRDVLGYSGYGVKYTTAQMKDQASYTVLGFDFDKCWSIDPTINDGYPYLDSQKEDKTDPAVDAVIAQIDALPATITLADQSSVQAARAAYTALSETQKALVTNLAKLTAAEAALAQLQPADTTPPVITVKDSSGLPLSDDLTVTEAGFSFKVTAQDEKDGSVTPSVQLNGTALTAGSDGTYTCTLSTGSNTISITATDAAGNQAQKSLKITLGGSGTLTPSLSKNSDGNYTVSSVADLNTLRGDIDKGIDYSGKTIVLTQDIDLSQAAVPLNSFTTQNVFNGCFDGKSHTISGYTDVKSGLFSLAGADSYIKNLSLAANVVIKDAGAIIKDATGQGKQGYGLIANESWGTISRCSTTGSVTNNVNCKVSGIVSYDYLTQYVNNKEVDSLGKIMNCFSNVVFNNQSTDSSSSPRLCGIAFYPGAGIEHCYFSGQFTGKTLDQSFKQPIIANAGCYPGYAYATTCAYDYTVMGFYQLGSDYGVKHTTDEMKNQATYTALGFDFDKCWSIDPAVNSGYPYLDPLKEDKLSIVKVDIQVTVADKTYDASLSEADNLKAVVTNVQIANPTPDIAALLTKYNVQVDYKVNSAKLSSRMGEWPVTVNFDKLELTYTPNDAYQFVINQVLTPKAKLIDNGRPGPDQAKQKELVESAKQAQTILYNSLKAGQGTPTFAWEGDKASAAGQEGTIQFDGKNSDGTSSTDIWEIFSAAHFGYSGVRAGYYDDWFQSVQTGLQAMKDAGIQAQDVKITEWEKLVLAITAIGYDPRDIKAYDLIDIISNWDYLKVSHQILAQQFALWALNSYNYPIPTTGSRIDKEAWIHSTAAGLKQPVDLSNSDAVRVVDLGLMQYQPIAAYYNPNAQAGDPYYDVKVAIDNTLALYSAAQTDLGYFYGGGGSTYIDNNYWNNAQVYMSIGMAKVNPFDSRFIKNGYSMFDAVLRPFNLAAGTCSFNSGTYDPGQIGRGLDSLVRAYEGRNNVYDCTDVTNSTVPVNNAIAALPETVTSADKAKVDAAEALYNALSDAQKASLQDSVKAKLAAAQLALNGGADQAAANAVIAQIDALPATITLADQSSVQAARAAYTALSEAQKALVTNLAKLTAAEATLAGLQPGGDTTPPVITIKDSSGLTLSEDLTVTEAGFSFKAIAQDEKDGSVTPSVQLNGTALTAGTDGTYSCTLSTGSNTITVTATDAAGNQAVKSLKVTLGTSAAFTIQRVGDETYKNGQEARLKVQVSNLTAASQDAVLIVALYRTDGGNKMVNYAYVSQTIQAGEQKELGAGFPVPESGTYTIKGFVWNNLDDMKALMAEPVAVNVAQS